MPDVGGGGRSGSNLDEAAEAYNNGADGLSGSKKHGGLKASPSVASLHDQSNKGSQKNGRGSMKNGRGGSNDGRDDYADEVGKVTGNGLNKQAAANGLQDGMNGQRRSRGGQGISQSALDNAPPSMLPTRGLNHSPSSQNISPDDYYAN